MTQFALNQNTQNLINIALSQGPGTNNVNYLNAYNAIYSNLEANGNINSGTLAWFSQAGQVNTEMANPNSAGAFIWGYTLAAAQSEGANLTNSDMQAASNAIALSVFSQLQQSNFSFNDQTTFSPAGIIQYDAGKGLAVLQADAPSANLDSAIWGGTLFAGTELQDPNYTADYNIYLAPGSRDCNAIISGLDGGAATVLSAGFSATVGGAWAALTQLNASILEACFLPPGTTNTSGLSGAYTEVSPGNFDFTFNTPAGSSGPLLTDNIAYNSNANTWLSNITVTNSSGQVTDKTSMNHTSNGSLTVDQQQLNTNQTIQNEQISTTQANGQETATISGQGDNASLSNAIITVDPNSQANINGSGNTINIGGGDAITEVGTNTIETTANGTSFSDTVANTTAVEDAQGNATFTSALSNGGTSSILLTPNGSGTITADGNSFNYAAGSLNQVSLDGNGGLLVTMPAAGNSGLSETIDIAPSGATILSGGDAVASAPSGGTVSDNGGNLTVTSTPVAGVTETVTEAPTGSFTETLQSNNTTAEANSFVLQFSSDPTTGLLAPTVVDFNSIDWTPTNTTPLNTFVGQTANTINNGDATAAQSQTQTALAADTNQFLNGVLPTGLGTIAPSIDPLLSDTSADGTDANTDQTYLVAGNQDIVDPYAVSDPGAGTVGGDGSGSGDTNTGDPSTGDTGGGDGGGDGGGGDPLVFSTNGQGITLLSYNQSNAAYNGVHTGWVGGGTAILVQSGANGSIQLPTFASLSALDANHDGFINSSDPGFSSLEVWSDTNGNGVVDSGELETLTQAGIASINLATTVADTNVVGNLISATSTLTFTNGVKEAIDLVAFASQGDIALNNQSKQAVSVIQQMASGNEANAAGIAQGVANTVPAMMTMLATDTSNLNTALAVSKPSITLDQKTTEPLEGATFAYAYYQTFVPTQSGINIFDYTAQVDVYVEPGGFQTIKTNNLYSLVTINAPAAALSSESAAATALTDVQTTAQQIVAAAMDQEQSQNAAFIANTSQAVLGSTQTNTALSAANTAESAWTSAFSNVLTASNALQVAVSTLATSQGIIGSAALTEGTISAAAAAAAADMMVPNLVYTVQLGPLRKGQAYATTQDALEAALSFTEQQAAAEGLASAEASFQNLLSAVEQAWNVTSIDLATAGTSATVTANSLVITASGTEAFTDGATASTYVLLPGATVTISGFKAGVGGSCLNFLSSGATATFTTVSNGIQITVGTSSVTLVGITSAQLSLTDNFAGIGAINVAALTDQSSLQIPATISDNGFNAIRSVYGVGASDAGALAGQVSSVSVSDTASNVMADIGSLQTLLTAGQLTSIALTDTTTPTLTLTTTQLASDTTVLGKITNAYSLSVSGVLAVNASNVSAEIHVSSVSISDSSADVFANITALQTLAAAGKISSILFTDTTAPTLALTAAQLTADATVLSKIISAYNLSVSGVLAANAAAVAAQTHVTSVAISDTAADVVNNISALQALAATGKLSLVILTDASTPTLALTAAQLTADVTALGRIISAYNLSVSGVLAANAATLATQAHVASASISDSAADVVTSIASLETLAAAGKINSIILTDATKPTLTLTSAQQTADAAVLSKIASAYNLLITGVSAATASIATTNVAISDTSANVWTYLPALQTQAAAGRISSIAFTDSALPTLALTATQLTADTSVLGKITSAYNLSISGVLAANAATIAAEAHVTSVAISDTSADVVANIAALQTLTATGKLGAVILTDTSTPTLALTATQLAADATALGKITSAYNLSISGVLAANAATVAAQTHVTSIIISDSSTDVVTNIAALQTLATAGKLGSVILTDTSTPTLALTATQLTADVTALDKITSAYNLSISSVLAANAVTVAAQAHIVSVTVSDTAADIVVNISALQTLAATGKLASVILTDTSIPTLALTAAQLTADAAALGKITSAYNLSISGVLTANAATVAAQAHITSLSISDTAADIVTNITALETLAAAGKIGSIILTDTTEPTLTLTSAQETANAAVLSKIVSAYNLLTTSVSAVIASTATTAVSVTDTSANIWTYLSALQTQAAAGRISSIIFTDTATPTLALTAPQLTSDEAVLGKITSIYNLSISGVLAANAATVATQAHVTSVAVSDTSADVVTNISALETLAVAGKLGLVVLTDTTTPTLALTAAQLAADTTALGKITSAYNLSVSGVLAANAAIVAAQAHVTAVSISDTAADIVTNISALQTLAAAGKLGAVILTDTSTPTLALTATQLAADATALGKITSAYNLSISTVLAANAATVAAEAHVTSVAISDTSADVVANIAALQTLAAAGKLSSVILTDATTPTLALTASQLAADATALGKISTAYNLSISGVLAANAATVAAETHITSIAVSDTSTDVVANIVALETLAAAGKISSIVLTDTTKPTLALTSAQQTADAAVLSKIISAYNLPSSSVSAATASMTTVPVAISDTSANVLTYLSALETQAAEGRISSITLTDVPTSTLALTAAQLTADATVLGKITSTYNLSISGVLAATAATLAAEAHVTSVTVSDTTANIVANLAALQALATAGKLASVATTDAGTLEMTSSQATSYAAALAKLANAHEIVITETSAVLDDFYTGTSDAISISNSNIAVGASIVATINGASDTLTSGASSTVTMTGSSDGTTVTGANAVANLNGTGDWLASSATGTQATANGASAYMSDTGASGNYTIEGSGDQAVVSGASDGVGIVAGGNNATVSLNGTQEWATIAANNAQVVVNGTNSWVTETAGTGSTLQFYGTGNTTVLSGAGEGVGINAGANNSTADINGNQEWATIAANNAQVVVNGTNSWITETAGTGSTLLFYGTGNTAVLSGASEGVGIYAGANNSTADLNGTQEWATIAANNAQVIVNGTDGWVTQTAGTGTVLQFYGIGNTAALSGASDGVTITSAAANSVATLSGAGDWATSAAAGTQITVNGTGAYVTDTGSNGMITVNNSGANVTLGGTNNAVSLSSTGDPVITISGSGSLTVTGSSAVTATIGNASQISFVGSNATIEAGASDTLSLSGAGNTVVLGGSDTVTNASGSDTYNVGTNVGVSVVNNAIAGGTTASGKVAFLSGITDESLWLKQSGSNLEIDLLGTSNKITLDGWYGSNASAQVQSFTAGGVTLVESQVAQLVSAMASYAASNAGFNPATATAMPTNTALQTTIAASWH